MSTWARSVVRIHYVVCDECSTGCDYHGSCSATAIGRAKDAGWGEKGGKILCPECKSKAERHERFFDAVGAASASDRPIINAPKANP